MGTSVDKQPTGMTHVYVAHLDIDDNSVIHSGFLSTEEL